MAFPTLDEIVDPMSLISLIELPEEPFSSLRYAFAIEKGEPVAYGRNDFQIRFADLEQRLITASGRYTDVRVKKPLPIAGVLADNTMTEVKNLAENEIRLYTFTGQTGDSIGIRLDGGAMWELYAPDGTTMMERSGSEAREYSSKTLVENGTYYLAVHDIASRYSNRVNVQFDHIGRHAIVDFTPDESADDNLLILNIHGNGFDKINSILLRGKDGDIATTDISVESNYRVYAIFDLAGKIFSKSDYKIVARYDDEVEGLIVVVPDKTLSLGDSDAYGLSLDFDTPFIARTPYHINIIVTNKSNKAYYGVPFNIAMKDMSAGTKIESINFALARNKENAPSPFYHVDNLLGTGKGGVYLPLVIPYIAPKETITYTIGLSSNPMDHYTIYAWNGTPWSEEIKEIENVDITEELLAEKTSHNWLSLYDLIDMYSRLMDRDDAEAAGSREKTQVIRRLGRAANAAVGTAKTALYAGGAIGLWTSNQRLAHTQAVLESCGYSMGDDIYYSSGLSTWDGMNAGMANVALDLMDAGSTGNNPIGNAQSLNSLANARHNYHATMNRPSHTPHTGTSYQSGDPNDIHGYESPSGTRYMGIDVKEVRYTIEFENDPEIANAPASRIDVENTIDLTAYDPASLAPVSLRLDNKEMELPGAHHFVRTLDMRPDISAIAELTFDYDPTTGLSRWSLRSLDPLTMEETPYMDSGILPVNDDSGRGTGFLTYSVKLRDGLADGMRIANSASIIFDDNDAIDTPVWENILDYRRPTARVTSVSTADNVEFEITVVGTDEGAGIWYYDLYARGAGSHDWTLVRAGVEDDVLTWNAGEAVTGAEFAVVAMDHAANRGSDSFLRALLGDADGNGAVDTGDVVVIISYYMDPVTEINTTNADVTLDGNIDIQDATGTITIYLDGSGRPQYKPQRKYNKK